MLTKPNAASNQKLLQPPKVLQSKGPPNPLSSRCKKWIGTKGLLRVTTTHSLRHFAGVGKQKTASGDTSLGTSKLPPSPGAQDVRNGSRDPTSQALDSSWHEMNSLILIPVFVCPAPNLSQQHESLPCSAPASCRDTTSGPSSHRAHRGSSPPQPTGFPGRCCGRRCFRGWEPCPAEPGPVSLPTAQSGERLSSFLAVFCEWGLHKHTFLCQNSGKD